MDSQKRREYFNRCKLEPLLPDDPRYVELDAARRRVRGIDWVDRLAELVELSDEPVCELFTGLPGSGKSTELLRLARRFEDPQQGNLLAVVLAADDLLDVTNPIDVPDIILAILYGTERRLLEREGQDADQAMQEGYFRRLWNWLTRTDVSLTKSDMSVSDVGKLPLELKTRPSLRAQVRSAVATHLNQFLDEAREELILMQARAEALGHRGIVVIFDSLEKLRGISSNWEEVIESAERVFSGGAPYLKLPVHAIYTIPTALVSRRKFSDVLFIPMIKLREQSGPRFAPGHEAARELLTRRVPEDALAELFGQHACETRIHALIEWSGGYPRELVRLLQNLVAVKLESWPLSDSDFQRLLNEVGDSYRRMIPADAFPWLARVAVDRYLTLETEAQRRSADLMLASNAVLRYLNDQEWFDLHPAVRQIPGVTGEIDVLLQSRRT
jgi:hypothetical protein